ncbi:MAG: DUF5723 family protein [Paludibacter sp.]|nr:DUF5723 family protein [Paludibacter sp.]
MKRTHTAIRYIALFCLLSAGMLHAQLINNMYFLDNSPLRHHYNPSFQPLNNFYVGFPILGNTQFNLDTDFPTFKEAGFNRGHVLNIESDKIRILSAVNPFSRVGIEGQVSLVDFGFRHNMNYWTLSITHKADLLTDVPYSFFDVYLNGFQLNDGYSADFANLNLDLNTYTETALGYSRNINDKVGFGAKIKMLYGNNYYSLRADQAELSVANKEVNALAKIAVVKASAMDMDNRLKLVKPRRFFNYLLPEGFGGALDLGMHYKPIPNLILSAAVTDLGMLRWNKLKSIDYALNYTFDEAESTAWLANHDEFSEVPADTIINDIRNSFEVTRGDLPAMRYYLSPKLNVSAEFGVLNNLLSVGVLSRTKFRNQKLLHELTTAFNVRPANWLNLALSYSITNGNASNFGLGANFRAGKFNIFLTADYIPFQYVGLDLQQFDPVIPAISFPLGYHADRMNVGLGFNYAIGTKKDNDKDRISDKFDRCPETLLGIKVDRHGCPVDSDKDGVPDYLDLCPGTPKEARAFVGTDGCPLDTDGDGVPDYLDKCPDSSSKARGYVDSIGCPIDTDQDGVMDYMDNCPETPIGIAVDSVGCPVDTDQDGVPDYLDLCPGSPAASRGFVDSNGCLLDTDDDGVPDYLDLCFDTPIEARGFVDINGCLIDADDDGVPDYRDDCKDTPFEAREMVDHRGCPKDTDFDGVPDYMDDCPRVSGLPEFRGCPEIKKEVRTLFQKAIQSIQFKEDTLEITPSSYQVLDQIVVVLKVNKNFNLEIQGHTDNIIRKRKTETGSLQLDSIARQKADSLCKIALSEEYAKLVKQYLTSKGISEKRLIVKGFGDTKPVASNQSPAGRNKNRRVELMIVFEEIKQD